MRDLFQFADEQAIARYPAHPGWTESTTSAAAARQIAPRAQTLREQVLMAYRTAWPNGLTADEAAVKVGRSILSIRPRVTELRRLGQLRPMTNGAVLAIVRENESGVAATVLICDKPEQP